MTEHQERIAEIRERLAKATPGPWHLQSDGESDQLGPLVVGLDADGRPSNNLTVVAACVGEWGEENSWDVDDGDAALIANAPSDLAFLLAQLDAAQADTRRLDWLEAVALERNVIASGIAPSSDTAMFSVGLEHGGGCDDFEGFSLREAIDAAMQSAGVSPEATEGTNG